ncbi:MAG: polysaccharide deacetylase family protein [Bacteroidota bacterium]|nr:polysaccharide deacetylase family protein [Bacteroidota bacterium]
MLVYCPELSPRLKYILELLLSDLLGIKYTTTNLEDEFIHFEGPKLNYSFDPIGSFPFLEASGMLFEPRIIDQSEAMGPIFKWTDLPVFYKTKQASILPFDIFSAAFYLVSRFEEYLPFEPDKHDRFSSSESLAFREGFLDKPIINLWSVKLGEVLKKLFGENLHLHFPEYRFIPTIDIDNAWAFKNKGLRGLGSFFKKNQTMEERNYRYQVIRGKQADPYDQYLLLQRLFKKHDLDPIYFFLAGNLGPYDRNVSPLSREFKNLVKTISREFKIGLHPSYSSNFLTERIQKEIHLLARLSDQDIIRSRQHFLKIQFPDTYRNLMHMGIKEEYTMGYADQLGFRASIANPFRFFDLESNKTTDLSVYPFQVMDVTLHDYMKLKPEEAIDKIADIIDQTRAVGGTFSALWHNESLSEWKEWTGWSVVFKKMLDMAV